MKVGSRSQDKGRSPPQVQEKEKQQIVAGESRTIAGGLVVEGSCRTNQILPSQHKIHGG